MTAKVIQLKFIKTYLKPTLKERGFKTSGQTWWKDKGDFFIVINLQNSQWNSKEELSFCLNIGIALTSLLADKEKKKVNHFDIIPHLRQNAYLTPERLQSISKGGSLGYKITDKTSLTEFIADFKIDLEQNILSVLDSFYTLEDCIKFYDKFEFWELV